MVRHYIRHNTLCKVLIIQARAQYTLISKQFFFFHLQKNGRPRVSFSYPFLGRSHVQPFVF